MPRTNVNDSFDEIFADETIEETNQQSQKTANQTNSNNGFFLNQNDIKFVNGLSQKKSDLMVKIINTEAIKQAVIKMGVAPTDEEILIADAIMSEIESQSLMFSEKLGDDNFKNFLSGHSQQLQITGYQAN